MASAPDNRKRGLGTWVRNKFSRSRSRSPTRDASPANPRTIFGSDSPVPTVTQQPAVDPATPSTILPSRTVATDSVEKLSLDEERSTLWEKAYNDLYAEKAELLEAYEAILAAESNIVPPAKKEPSTTAANKQEVMQGIVEAQRARMENRQWTWALFGSQKTLRETANATLQLVQNSSGLIAVGMAFAPPFVSIPWSVVSALIPLIMNNSVEQQAAINGLKQVTEILFAFRIAEETFLLDPSLGPAFHRAVSPLYCRIIEYQAAATVYFGRNTLSRLGRDILAGTRWTDALTAVKASESHSKSATGFLGGLQHQSALKTLLEILSEQSHKIAELTRDTASRNDETTQAMLWASEVPYYQDHARIRADLTTLRRQWILGDKSYQHWRTKDSGILFLEGTVGKGKTSLISEVIEDVLKSATSKTAYFYCSHTNSTGMKATDTSPHDNPLTIIRAIMAQLLLSSDGLSVAPALLDRFRATPYRVPGGCMSPLSDCLEILRESLLYDATEKWTIIVDALDECSEPGNLVNGLKSIIDINPKACLFLSSREGNVEFVRARYFPKLSEIRIKSQNEKDIKYYVRSEIELRSEGTDLNDAQAVQLTDVLVRKAEGMFRWLVLQMDLLFPKKQFARPTLALSYALRIKKLENSPLDPEGKLRETYREIFDRATGNGEDEPQYKIICHALRWVLYAFRSLTAKELAYASAGCSDRPLPEGLTANFILINAANLLVQTEYDDVRLAHLSVAEFLKTAVEVEFSPGNAHQQIALICCGLLDGPEMAPTPAGSHDDLPETGQMSPSQDQEALRARFRDYASRYWPAHCRRAAASDALESCIPPIGNFVSLHRAIRSSRYDALSAMIARKINLETMELDGYSPLHEAVRLGDDLALQHLIHNGASVDTQDVRGDFPIHTAATLGFKSVLERLLRSGADIDKKNRRGDTALHIATYRNQEDVLRVLVEFGAQLSLAATGQSTPLHFASRAGLFRIVNVLVARGADPSAPNVAGDTPLHLAARYGQIEAFNALLATGAKADCVNRAGVTPLEEIDIHGLHTIVSPREGSKESRTKNEEPQPRALPSLRVTSADLCTYCDVQKWFKTPRKGVKHGHHRTLAGLKRSALLKGCQMCQLFYRGLFPSPEDIQASWTDNEVFVELILTFDHGRIFTLDKDLLKVSLGSIAEYSLEICVDEDSALKEFIAGTVLLEDSGSQASLSLVQNWRDDCLDHHVKCRLLVSRPTDASSIANSQVSQHKLTSELPKRLVDISTVEDEEGTLSLLSGESLPGESMPYGFLSHRYGHHEVRVSTRKIMDEGKVLLTEVEKSIQDAIRILRHVDIRYLWVDKLCIDMANTDEMVEETAKLVEYARNADLVVNAGDHMDQEGIFDTRENGGNLLRVRIEWFEESSSDLKVADSLYLRQRLRGPEECFCDDILIRAWMFQELALPRNVVLYGKDRVYWKCREMMRAEGSPWETRPFLDFGGVASWSLISNRQQNSIEDQWYIMLELYSAKQLSMFGDRLAAVHGMAMAVYWSSQVGSYSCGLWVGDLDRGLLWYTRMVRRANRPSLSPPLPSWSWASLEGAVSFSMIWGLSKSSRYSHGPTVLQRLVDLKLGIRLEACDTPRDWLFEPPNLQVVTVKGFSNEIVRIEDAAWRQLSRIDFEQPTNLQILFDTWQDEVDWRDSHHRVGVLINKWSADENMETARWIGLLLAEEERDGVRGYIRCGLLLGPWFDDDTAGWKSGFLGVVF